MELEYKSLACKEAKQGLCSLGIRVVVVEQFELVLLRLVAAELLVISLSFELPKTLSSPLALLLASILLFPAYCSCSHKLLHPSNVVASRIVDVIQATNFSSVLERFWDLYACTSSL